MKTPLRLVVLLVSVVAALATMSSVALGASRLVYSDEFNGPLDTATWRNRTPWNTQSPGNAELAYYEPANCTFANGMMTLRSENRSTNGYAYASGIATSLNRAKFSYGYFEIRAKLPKGKGIWPAFWLTNDSTLEIDALEMLGDRPTRIYMTLHKNGSQVQGVAKDGPDYSAGFHTYAVDWQPTYVKWYIDGQLCSTYNGPMPSDPLWICLNTAVGGAWPGSPTSATSFPVNYDIDYVRVYDTKPAANTAPAVNADSYTTANATTLNVSAPGLLRNDTDADGNSLSASAVSQPANGTLSLSPAGSFAYTPEAGFEGVDSFTYRAYDGSAYSSAVKVTITVAAPVVHAPVARADSYETNSGTTLTVAASGVLANDTDAQGHTLIASAQSQPAHGTLSFLGDGSFVYVPAEGYSGPDSFTYLASDGTAVSSASVSISVVDPSIPPAVHKPLRVYRFLNRSTSVHFYTASEAEKANVVDTLSSTYSLEGVAYSLDTSAAANTAPLYRFYNVKKGVHFYTASEEERDTLLNTMGDVYRYDGVACNISLTPTGSQPVYRFYNVKKGVHFYTASLAERDSVESRLSGTYRYEGVAYYYAP